jgi:hypothetical protein
MESVELLSQKATNHVSGRLLSSVAGEQNDSHWRSEQTSARSFEDELAMLWDAVAGFETEQQAACDKNSRPEGTRTISHVEGVLEMAISYIHHLQEQEKTYPDCPFHSSHTLPINIAFLNSMNFSFQRLVGCRWLGSVGRPMKWGNKESNVLQCLLLLPSFSVLQKLASSAFLSPRQPEMHPRTNTASHSSSIEAPGRASCPSCSKTFFRRTHMLRHAKQRNAPFLMRVLC